MLIIDVVVAINIPCFGSPLWENRSLWFWKEKVGFGLANWAGLIRALFVENISRFSNKYPLQRDIFCINEASLLGGLLVLFGFF
jgi:hypothetical protein